MTVPYALQNFFQRSPGYDSDCYLTGSACICVLPTPPTHSSVSRYSGPERFWYKGTALRSEAAS